MRGRAGSFLAREDGVAAIEFALIVILVMPLFLAALDMGLAIRQRMQIDHVLRMGAQAAMVPGASRGDIGDALAAAATNNPALGQLQLVVSPMQCFCRDAPATVTSCTTSCLGAGRGSFFDLTAQMRYQSLFLGDLLPDEILTLRSRLRIEVLGGTGS